ncbi:hypothetical protein ACJD0Z_12830 [Flavobacteriaceae bacterium M23B6Z8]
MLLRSCFVVAFMMVFIGCKSPVEVADYLGQVPPDTTPMVFAPDQVSVKERFEHGISFSPDMKELAFGVLDKDDFSGKIHYAKKGNESWTKPTLLEILKDESAFLPYFSPDGETMLFAKSSSPEANYITDIWKLHKQGEAWLRPEKINHPLSSSSREAMACATLDNTIYFSSNREGNGLADLYFSKATEGVYADAERIDALSTERDEESIFVSPEGNYIIFSRYASFESGPDLFISYKDIKGNWTKPEALDAPINTMQWERRPFVTTDHQFLFFTRKTFEGEAMKESDIYWVNTKKVFKPYVFNPIPETILKIGTQTKVKVPKDYFKDINEEELAITCADEKLEWTEFDSDTMMLTLNPDETGKFELVFKAIDGHSNETTHTLKVEVVY